MRTADLERRRFESGQLKGGKSRLTQNETDFIFCFLKISSPSPREFGPLNDAIESNAGRIHEERGLGGEEQKPLLGRLVSCIQALTSWAMIT